MREKQRCSWATAEPNISYHDTEWGVPHHDDRALFELLILEGAPAVLCGIASWIYLTDRPRDARWLDPEQRDWLIRELKREEGRVPRTSFLAALRHPYVLILCVSYFGTTMGNYGVSLWMPKMLQQLGHLSAVRTSLLSAIPAIVAVPVMLFTGFPILAVCRRDSNWLARREFPRKSSRRTSMLE